MTGQPGNAHFDLVVVGAGPGGIAAAAVAAEAGLSVCLLDDNIAPGGQIWRGFRPGTAGKSAHGKAFLHWTARLRSTPCQIWADYRVVGHPAQGRLRVECSHGSCDIGFEKLILATGARERFLPFPGWTLPGVMGVGGVQALVKGGLDPRVKRIALAGSGPLLLAVSAYLQSVGATVCGVFEQAPVARLAALAFKLLAQPSKLVEGLGYRFKTRSVPHRFNAWVLKAEGRGRVEHVTLTNGRSQWTVDCDWLGCAFHLVPNLELPRLFGCAIENGFVTVSPLRQSSVDGVACIGELTGIGGLGKALVEGEIAGLAAAGREDEALSFTSSLKKQTRFTASLDRAFALRAELRSLASADTILCRCEDVTLGSLKDCNSWRTAKLHTRCGMGACQGRVCGSAAEFLFNWQNTSVRPPVLPATVSTLAAGTDAITSMIR
jgi:NADPH-dependent 2,4-dienoyl-CoA reductase/sulfur reductase-like enzyme